MRSAALLLPASLAMMLVACGDKSEADDGSGDASPENAAPTARIDSHVDGDTEREGYGFTLSGSVGDADGAIGALSVVWTADGTVLCEGTAADEDGTTTCATELDPGDAEIQLQVTDEDGASASAAVSLTINPTDAPDAEITSPEANGRFYADIPVGLSAVIGDGEDSVADLEVRWSSSLAPDSPFSLDIDDDGNVSGEASLGEGSHVLTLEVTDTTGKTATTSVEITVGAANSAPICAIATPADGTALLQGAEASFAGSAVDADIPADVLEIAWTSDVDGIIDETHADLEGAVGFSTASLSPGPHTITLAATDDTGAACADSVDIFVGDAPVVSLDSPLSGDIFDQGETVVFTATVSDTEDAAEGLAISWQSADGTELGTSVADASGATSFSTDALDWGAHSIVVEATDSHGFTSSSAVDITVNGLPSAPGISFDATSVDTTSTLVVNIDTDAVDPEGESVSYGYSWAKDGVATGETGASLDSALTSRGETWTVSVAGSDSRAAGAATEISVTIGNAVPVLSDVALGPADATITSPLVCAATASDADGDSLSTTYSWTIDGVTNAETGATLAAGTATAGQAVICTATVDDGIDTGAPLASAALTIQNSAPEISAVDVTPADPTTETDISCAVTAADIDGDSLTTSYTWIVNGTPTGTTGDTLSASAFFEGDTVVCEATVDDGTDSSDPVSSVTLTVGNTVPSISSVAITPDPAMVADDLSCAAVTVDPDSADTVSVSYAWTINGSAAGTGDTLASGAFAKGDTVICTATPDDGTDTGAAVSSSVLTISNTPPTVKSLALGPSGATSADTLTCTATGQDADFDGVGFTYAWSVDGSDPGVTTATLDPSYFSRGQAVSCTVTPYDSRDTGVAETSATLTIANGAPSIATASISPSAPVAGEDLSCVAPAVDPDGDSVSVAYAWTVNGVDMGVSGDTLTSAFFGKGDSIVCAATPSDASDTGATATSAAVSVANTAPELVSVTLSPTAPATDDSVTCTPIATDADGDIVSYSYSWTKNGVDLGNPTNSVHFSNFVRDDVLVCTVTPNDGADSGSPDTATVTIANTEPEMVTASIPNASPTTDTVLTATGATTDDDGDAVSINWEWYVNGLSVATGASLSGAIYFDKGDSVYAVGTPTDGTDAGAPLSTAAVTVQNSAPTAPLVLIDPADPTEDDDLICDIDTPSVDADGDTVTYSISWEVDGAPYAGITSTTTEADDTIPFTETTGEEEWACIVTPHDGTTAGTFGDDVVEVLPSQRVYTIDAVDLLDPGAVCSGTEGSDANRYTSGTTVLGFEWLDLDTRTPVDVTVEIGWGWDCDAPLYGTATRDMELNGTVVDGIPLDPGGCFCGSTDTTEFLHTSFGPAILADYTVGDVNTVTFALPSNPNYGQALSRLASLDGYYARITVDY